MNNRHRGDYFERQTRSALEAFGWVVIRAAGSLGPADLVALKDTYRPLLISCKLNGRIGPRERIELVKAAVAAGGRPICALRPKPGYVELRTVRPERGMWVVIDTLHVPTRRGVETSGNHG